MKCISLFLDSIRHGNVVSVKVKFEKWCNYGASGRFGSHCKDSEKKRNDATTEAKKHKGR